MHMVSVRSAGIGINPSRAVTLYCRRVAGQPEFETDPVCIALIAIPS